MQTFQYPMSAFNHVFRNLANAAHLCITVRESRLEYPEPEYRELHPGHRELHQVFPVIGQPPHCGKIKMVPN